MRRTGFALVLLGCCHAITLPPTPLLALRGGANDRQALVLKGSGLPPLDKVVDACLAGLGLAGSCALLGVMEPRFGVKLFVPPMMASGILFFSPVKPPSPKGILSGTVGCASVSAVVFSLLSGAVSPAAASGAAAGALLMWYKATECIFPPAAVVCVLMAGQAGQASGLKALTSPAGLNWLATTWLGGHACMYAGAMGTAVVRGKARQVSTPPHPQPHPHVTTRTSPSIPSLPSPGHRPQQDAPDGQPQPRRGELSRQNQAPSSPYPSPRPSQPSPTP